MATADSDTTADASDLTELDNELADADNVDLADLEAGVSGKGESDVDLASDLEDMANMLDQSAGGSDKSDQDDLSSLDLGELSDLDTSFDGDFDDDNPFADLDEVGTKLDLARAYVEMGDKEGAQGIIDEVMQEGSDEQKQEAQSLLDKL